MTKMLRGFLDTLPKIATHPLAIAAYICVLAAWLLFAFRVRQSKDFLQILDSLPQQERAEFSRKAGFSYDELATLPRKSRLTLLTRRYLLIAFIASLIAIVLIVLAVESRHRNSATALERIESARATLQQKLDEESLRSQKLVRGVEHALGKTEVNLSYEPSNRIKELAADLKRLLAEYDTHFGKPADERADLSLRLARATAFNAIGQYDQALSLVTEQDALDASLGVSQAVDNAIRIYWLRGNAFYGKRQWSKAQVCYSQVLALQPDHPFAHLWNARCLFQMGLLTEALNVLNLLIPEFQTHDTSSEMARDNKTIGRIHLTDIPPELTHFLASALDLRGITFHRLNRLPEALTNLDQSVSLFTWITKQGGKTSASLDLAEVLGNRAITYRELGKLPETLSNQNEAIALYYASDDGERKAQWANDFAMLLNNRGVTYTDLGEFPEAIESITAAIALRQRLINQGQVEVEEDLVPALVNRAMVYNYMKKFPDALTDCEQAAKILSRFDLASRPELAVLLVKCLHNRAFIYLDSGKLPQASHDLDQAAGIVAIHRLGIQHDPRGELDASLATLFFKCGIAYRDLGKMDDAFDSVGKAVALYIDLVRDKKRTDLNPQLSSALLLRAESNWKTGFSRDHAIADLNLVIELNAKPNLVRIAQEKLSEIQGRSSQ